MTDEVILDPKTLQQLLITNRYNLGKFGADGKWGTLTSRALEDWFKSGSDLLNPSEDVTTPATFDDAAFYDTLRAQIGSLNKGQVDGINLILDEWKSRNDVNVQEFAYLLGTAYWESGKTMQPVREAFYIKGDAEAWRKRNLRYYPYYGRGLVQLTWDYNYRKASQLYGKDFVANPDLALDPVYAVKIIFDGMVNGWFTGKALDDYIDDTDESDSEDLKEYIAARRIVNGTDKATEIGKLSLKFEKAIKAGLGI